MQILTIFYMYSQTCLFVWLPFVILLEERHVVKRCILSIIL
jgi:hypothetical protein